MTTDDFRMLLLRIVYQPGFRAALIADPENALAAIGIQFDLSEMGTDPLSLPTDQAILLQLEQMVDAIQMHIRQTHISICLQLGGP